MEKWKEVISRAGYEDWADWLLLENAVLNKKEKTLSIAFSNADMIPQQAKEKIGAAFQCAFKDLSVSLEFIAVEQVKLDE